jgi:hypothetical protein
MKETNGHDQSDDQYKKISAKNSNATARLQNFYCKYKESILFNKNLLIADTCSLFASALFAEIYFILINGNYLANAVFTALVEYSVDTPIFFALYYIDNRHKYVIQDGGNNIGLTASHQKIDTQKIRKDIIRLLGAFSICDVMYVVIKVFVQFQLLEQTNLQPYQAAMLSSLIGWATFLILINITMKAIKIFNSVEIKWYYVIILSISISNSVIFFSSPDTKVLYDNLILDSSAGLAASSALIVLFRHLRQQRQQQLQQQDKKLMSRGIDSSIRKVLFMSLAAGITLWFTAEVIWAYYQVWLGIDNPFPSIADALWLIGYGFFIYNLYKLFNSLRIRTAATTATNARNYKHLVVTVVVVIAIASTYIATVFIFAMSTNPFDGHQHGYQDILGFIISIAYPILDGVMLVPAVTILWSLRRADPAFTHWILICTFIIMLTIGDIGFGYSELIINEDTAKKQLWIWDTFYNASYISIAAALLWYNKFTLVSVTSGLDGGLKKKYQ